MLTVMFATHNGAKHLPDVLGSFATLHAPRGGWKLVIADNGSTDRTRDVVESFRSRLPVEYVFAAEPGKNAALNAGLGKIDGALLVLTDDDVFPRFDWLLRLEAAADAQPDYSVFGGAVVPRWAEPPQDWLTKWVHVAPTFSISDPAKPRGPTGADHIFGPNMAVRSSVFSRGVRFDCSIGPRGGSYAMGSETEFVMRLLHDGHKAWFVPDAIVEHFVRKSQMRKSWVLQRAVRYGRGQYRLTRDEQPADTKVWAGVPRFLFRQLAHELGNLVSAALRADERRVFQARWQLNYIRGEVIEAYALHRNRRSDAGLG